MPSYVNLTQLLRVWFSNDPDLWLPELNQERLVKLMADSPDSKVTLLTRTASLSDSARRAMEKFENRHENLVIVDIDDLIKTLTHPDDLALAGYVLEELKVKQPAAARDLVTAIPAVAILGHYGDFDTKTKTAGKPYSIELACEPGTLLLPILRHGEGSKAKTVMNNDAIVIPSSESKLTEADARKALSVIIAQMLKAYRDPRPIFSKMYANIPLLPDIIQGSIFLTMISPMPQFREDVLKFFTYDVWKENVIKLLETLAGFDVSNLRKALEIMLPLLKDKSENLSLLSSDDEAFFQAFYENQKNHLEKQFIMSFSGPRMYATCGRGQWSLEHNPELINTHSIYAYPQLSEIFGSAVELRKIGKKVVSSDISWMPAGRKALSEYTKTAGKAASKIQTAYGNYRVRRDYLEKKKLRQESSEGTTVSPKHKK